MTGITDGSKLCINGCEVYSDCFTCPYPDCIVAITPSSRVAMFKRAEAFKLKGKGFDTERIASKMQTTEKQVEVLLTKIP